MTNNTGGVILASYLLIGFFASCWATRYAGNYTDGERGTTFLGTWLCWPLVVVIVVIIHRLVPLPTTFHPFAAIGRWHRERFGDAP